MQAKKGNATDPAYESHTSPATYTQVCEPSMLRRRGAKGVIPHTKKTNQTTTSIMHHACINMPRRPPPRVHRSQRQYRSASKGMDAMQPAETKPPNTATNMNHKHKRRHGMAKRSAQRKKNRGKGVRRVHPAARNGSDSLTHSILDDRQTYKQEPTCGMEKKNLEEGQTRKGKVSCDATQSQPTTSQPKRPSHALQVHEDRIRRKTRQTTKPNRYGKAMFAPRQQQENTMVPKKKGEEV